MNKICGYSCEHNKSGVCQITACDKIGKLTNTTQWLSGGRQQGKTYQLIKNQQKEIERLNNIIEIKANRIEQLIRRLSKRQEKIDRLNNIINELEKWLKDYINLFDKPDILEEQTLEDLKEVLDKLKELKENK